MFEISKGIKEHGNFIKYNILPAGKIVSFLIIKDKQTFNQILHRFKGVVQERRDQHLVNDTNFQLLFPAFDFSGKARIYQLENGLFCIDQSLPIKGNPYYICESYEDYILITKYLHIYIIEELKSPVVETHLFNPKLIKDFLNTQELVEVIEFEMRENSKLFRASNGYYVVVESVPKDGFGELFNFAYQIEDNSLNDIVYHSLAVYETLDIMKVLCVFKGDDY